MNLNETDLPHDELVGCDRTSSYTNSQKCSYYEGFPNKLTDLRRRQVGPRRLGGLGRLGLVGKPDVDLVRVALAWLAMLRRQLVVEVLEGGVAERADAHGGVALLLTIFFRLAIEWCLFQSPMI